MRLTPEREKEIKAERIISSFKERFSHTPLSSHRFWAELYHTIDLPLQELLSEIDTLRNDLGVLRIDLTTAQSVALDLIDRANTVEEEKEKLQAELKYAKDEKYAELLGQEHRLGTLKELAELKRDEALNFTKQLLEERDQLKAAQIAYANEFDDDTGNIHKNIRQLKGENQKLRGRIARLRAIMIAARDCNPGIDGRGILASGLEQDNRDEEMEDKK